MPKISVIVPVFQVEQYISRCAESLFRQTLEDVQFIFVNDCSNDRSIEILGEIIQDFPDRKEQIIILNHTRNMGIPSSRRDGFNLASGDYVIHCDSDDWWEADAFEQMYEAAVSSHSDVLVCGYYLNYSDGRQTVSSDSYSKDMTISLMKGAVPGYLWNKLVARDLYSELAFMPVANMWDDIPVVIQLVEQCNSLTYINKPLYHYFQHMSSTANSNNAANLYQKSYDAKLNTEVVEQYLNSVSKDIKYSKFLDILKMRSLLYCYPILKNKEYYSFFRSSFPGLGRRLFFNNEVSLKTRAGFILRRMGLYK